MADRNPSDLELGKNLKMKDGKRKREDKEEEDDQENTNDEVESRMVVEEHDNESQRVFEEKNSRNDHAIAEPSVYDKRVSDKFEQKEVVVHKKLVESEVNAMGSGLWVLNNVNDSTCAPGGGDLNPPLAVPETLYLNDEELNQQWRMEFVETSSGRYLKSGWYLFASEHGLKVGDTVKIERTLVKQNSEVLDTNYDITIERAENSSTGSN